MGRGRFGLLGRGGDDVEIVGLVSWFEVFDVVIVLV